MVLYISNMQLRCGAPGADPDFCGRNLVRLADERLAERLVDRVRGVEGQAESGLAPT
jgi:hypothetical protein